MHLLTPLNGTMVKFVPSSSVGRVLVKRPRRRCRECLWAAMGRHEPPPLRSSPGLAAAEPLRDTCPPLSGYVAVPAGDHVFVTSSFEDAPPRAWIPLVPPDRDN